MKKILLLCAFCFCLCTLSFSQQYGWVKIDPASINGTPDLSALFFTDADTGWITTSTTANIYGTDDGAASFSTQTTPLGATSAIHMLNGNIGYSGGQGGWVYNTTDGGLNWNILATMGSLSDISFPFNTDTNNPIGYACGDAGRVWEITSTLTDLNSPSQSDFGGISAPSVNNVWVCGGNRIYYYDGTDFTSQTAPGGFFNDIHFINNQEGWVVGDGGVIGHTTDGGDSWNTQTNPDPQNLSLYSVFFLDSDNGWAVGNGGIILQTTDGGTTWTIEEEGLTTAFLNGVHFTSATNGYVVGNGKTLIKYGVITSVENEKQLPTEFSLSQNYPNPFNPVTKIKYTIPTPPSSSPLLKGRKQVGFVTLKVYDVLGNEITTLVNEYKPAGTYEVEFNLPAGRQGPASSIWHPASGVYFYQLRIGDLVETKKMLLLK